MNANQGRVPSRAAAVAVTALAATLWAGGGCASRGRASIAAGARAVTSGTGTIEYTAARDGSVYALEADSNRLIGLGGVTAGQTVRVDAEADQFVIGDKVITRRPISETHRYEILFRPDSQRNDR